MVSNGAESVVNKVFCITENSPLIVVKAGKLNDVIEAFVETDNCPFKVVKAGKLKLVNPLE